MVVEFITALYLEVKYKYNNMWRFFKNMNDKDFKEMVAVFTILFCFVYFIVITFITIPPSGQRYADIILGALIGTVLTKVLAHFFDEKKNKNEGGTK